MRAALLNTLRLSIKACENEKVLRENGLLRVEGEEFILQFLRKATRSE